MYPNCCEKVDRLRFCEKYYTEKFRYKFTSVKLLKEPSTLLISRWSTITDIYLLNLKSVNLIFENQNSLSLTWSLLPAFDLGEGFE